jgi:hypothetical protein
VGVGRVRLVLRRGEAVARVAGPAPLTLTRAEGEARVEGALEPGLYAPVGLADDVAARTFVVGLDPRESDLRALPLPGGLREFGAAPSYTPLRAWLVLLALLALLGEALLRRERPRAS